VIVPVPLLAGYVAGTLIWFVRWWLEQEPAYSPEQLDGLFRELALPGVQRAAGQLYDRLRL